MPSRSHGIGSVASLKKPTLVETPLWTLIESHLNPYSLVSPKSKTAATIQRFPITGIVEAPIQVRSFQTIKPLNCTSGEPVSTNVIFFGELNFDEIYDDESVDNFEKREKSKSWFKRYKTSLDYFRFQTKMDQVMNAARRCIRREGLSSLYHELYIPIKTSTGTILIRIELNTDVSPVQIKIFYNRSSGISSAQTKSNAKKIRNHLLHSLAFLYDLPLNSKKRIQVEPWDNLMSEDAVWTIFSPHPTEEGYSELHSPDAADLSPYNEDSNGYNFKDDILSGTYQSTLRAATKRFGSEDDPREMEYAKHTPDSMKRTTYKADDPHWQVRLSNGWLYTLWCQIAFIGTIILSVTSRSRQAAEEVKEARIHKTNLSALSRTDFRIQVAIAISCTVLVCIAIVAIAAAGGPAAFLALPALKMASTFGAAVVTSVKALFSLSWPAGLEGWMAVLAFTGSWIAEKTIFPQIWRTIKLPFRRGWESKSQSRLDWKNYIRLHAWRHKRGYVPKTNPHALYEDMGKGFQETQSQFKSLLDFVHSQYKRYTIAGGRLARYEEELAYWARLRRKIREGKMDEVTKVLYYYEEQHQKYVKAMGENWASKIGKDKWKQILGIINNHVRDKHGNTPVKNFRKTESELKQHLKACRREILKVLKDAPSRERLPGGSSAPTRSANELYAHFSEYWIEQCRLGILGARLQEIDKVVTGADQPSLKEVCLLEYEADRQKAKRRKRKRKGDSSHGKMAKWGVGPSEASGAPDDTDPSPEMTRSTPVPSRADRLKRTATQRFYNATLKMSENDGHRRASLFSTAAESSTTSPAAGAADPLAASHAPYLGDSTDWASKSQVFLS